MWHCKGTFNTLSENSNHHMMRQYHHCNNILTSPFTVSHDSCSTISNVCINCSPSFLSLFFIMGTLSVSVILLYCLVENIFVIFISKFLSSVYLFIVFQLKVGCSREGPALCPVVSGAPLWPVFMFCLLLSHFIAHTIPLPVSTAPCATACFIASVPA